MQAIVSYLVVSFLHDGNITWSHNPEYIGAETKHAIRQIVEDHLMTMGLLILKNKNVKRVMTTTAMIRYDDGDSETLGNEGGLKPLEEIQT